MRKNKIPLDTPGEILLEEFLRPLHISQYKLAKDIRVPQIRISEIVRGLRAITPDTALRLGKYFEMSAGFWINLQNDYDLRKAGRKFEAQKIKSLDEGNLKIANNIAITLGKKFQY